MTAICWLDQVGVLAALAALDGVVILPTDTLPGLHARLDRPQALARLHALKGRTEARPFLVLCSDLAVVTVLTASLSTTVHRFLTRLWPGPFTAILPAAKHLSVSTVAVRVPEPESLRGLLARSGPLASTSANQAGCEPALDVSAAAELFPELPVWRAALPASCGKASALVDLTGDRPRTIRPGRIALPPWDDVLG